MKRTALIALMLTGCGIFEPDEYWCAKTFHFTQPDSGWASPTDSTARGTEVDSVVVEWSVDGECPDEDAGR